MAEALQFERIVPSFSYVQDVLKRLDSVCLSKQTQNSGAPYIKMAAIQIGQWRSTWSHKSVASRRKIGGRRVEFNDWECCFQVGGLVATKPLVCRVGRWDPSQEARRKEHEMKWDEKRIKKQIKMLFVNWSRCDFDRSIYLCCWGCVSHVVVFVKPEVEGVACESVRFERKISLNT